MKRSISILLCLVLILSSFSFAAAVDWSTTDSSNLASIKNAVNSGGVLYAVVNTISTRLQYNNVSIGQMVQNIYNALYATYGGSNRSVAWWLQTMNDNLVTIAGFLDPANTNSMAGILNQILNALVYTDAGGVVQSWLMAIEGYNYQSSAYLKNLRDVLINYGYGKNANNPWTVEEAVRYAHYNLLRSPWGTLAGGYNLPRINGNGTFANENAFWQYGSPIGNIALMLMTLNYNYANSYVNRWQADLLGYNSTQSLVSFANPYSTVTFTPSSATDGIYKYLNAINTPLARLGYVLASDSRIEAQEAAAANEQAVVDNFIDSSGDGAVPTNSFSDVSGLSSGVTSNLSTDASPAQIWDIFNSDHGSWFSQETANQLDTTTRTRGSEFETPLLDQQMEEIYKSLGGGK